MNRIREVRKEKQLTLIQLGELVGVTKSSVQHWEKLKLLNYKRRYYERIN